MKHAEAIALLTPSGGGVSDAEAEKTSQMLRDYLEWKEATRREREINQLRLALELMPTPDKAH